MFFESCRTFVWQGFFAKAKNAPMTVYFIDNLASIT